ncbi:hypothetical protein [Labilibacter marinus]|uniref:hypothetical protein n=1 Tax=Labilibacter marinus TaxID=1477105 RepID=UPI000834CD6F|nr:hypothetical protein [Labilibacter marinus]
MKSLNLYLILLFCFIIGSGVDANSQELSKDEIERAFVEIDFNTIYYPEKAKQQFDSIRGVLTSDKQSEYIGYINFLTAEMLFKDLKVDSSLLLVESSIGMFTSQDNRVWLAKCQHLLGRIAEATGLMEQAKINYYEAINLSDETNGWVGSAYIGIARCKRVLGELFMEDLTLGIKYMSESDRREFVLYARLIKEIFNLGAQGAPDRLGEVADEYLALEMYDRVASVYKMIASSYNIQSEFDSAHEYCDRAIGLCEVNETGGMILPALYQFKGVLYFRQSRLNVAGVYFERSLKMYEINNQPNRMLYAYNYIHQIDVAKGNYKRAYRNLQEYNDLVEKTTSSEKVRMAKVLEINNKVALMKGQLAQLKTEKKASEFMLYLVLVITIVVLLGVGVYIYLYQKSKKAKIEELNKEFHNLLIGIGEKQLLEHRLNSSQNLSRKDRKELSFVDSSGLSVASEGGIGDSFDSCYMETINLFTDSFPQLTKTEVRYSVMICLRLPIEVIAKVQNVQPASIRKAKQRIRTKLDVKDSLEDYLQEFRERQISSLAV